MKPAGSPQTRVAAVAGNAIAVLFGTVVAFGAAEVLTRVFVPDPYLSFENRAAMFQRDDRVGFKNRPNFLGYSQGTIRVRTNNLGYRGEPVSPQKAPNAFRIVGLGDSVTWGVGVQEQETYLEVLERRLNEARAPGSRFEAVNTAVIGYSLHLELLTLKHSGLALLPDVVLLGFVMNDFYPTEDPFFNVHGFHEPGRNNVRRRAYVDPPPPRSYFYQLFRSHARRLRERVIRPADTEQALPVAWGPGSFEAANWPVMEAHFREMKRLSELHGFRLLVILFPTTGHLRPGDPPAFPPAQIEGFLRSEHMEYLDLSRTLNGHEREAFLDTMHLSPTGHKLVAEAIERSFYAHGWVPQVAR